MLLDLFGVGVFFLPLTVYEGRGHGGGNDDDRGAAIRRGRVAPRGSDFGRLPRFKPIDWAEITGPGVGMLCAVPDDRLVIAGGIVS